MPKEIHSLRDLQTEIAILKAKQAVQEEQLRGRLKKMSEDLKPINLIRSTIQSFTQGSGLKGETTKRGAEAAIGFLVSNILFKNFNPVARTVATVVGTGLASELLGEQAGKYIQKFKDLAEKFRKSGKEKKDLFDEQDIYGQ